MPSKTSLHEVILQPASKEYKDVLANFEMTMQSTSPPGGVQGGVAQRAMTPYNSIFEIRRVQNLALYAQYIAKKKEMDKNNKPGHQNETRLFHGTDASTCPKINQQGFNRSFSGKNGEFVLHSATRHPRPKS